MIELISIIVTGALALLFSLLILALPSEKKDELHKRHENLRKESVTLVRLMEDLDRTELAAQRDNAVATRRS